MEKIIIRILYILLGANAGLAVYLGNTELLLALIGMTLMIYTWIDTVLEPRAKIIKYNQR